MRHHFILCGLGKVGWRVLDYLRKAGEPVVVVDTRCNPIDPRLDGATLIVGDCRQPEVLRQAGIAEARGVVVLTSDDLVSLPTALMIRHLNPSVRIVVRMFNQGLITRLGDAAANITALSTSALSSPLLAMIARTGQALGTFGLPSGETRQIAEVAITAQSPLVGKRVDDLTFAIVAHIPAGGSPRFARELDPAATVAVGDRLVVAGAPSELDTLLAQGEPDSRTRLLWGNLIGRIGRVLQRGLTQIDLTLKICAAIFVSVIIVSVLIFHLGMKDDGWIDAFYRTISLLATGADMHGDEVERDSWQKAFISMLSLVGTALTAAFTAIFTNYLIRANLGAALELRRVPQSGHIIICGLGNVGFRVVQELRSLGEQVVVIEQDANNPFVPTARRLGAAVLFGNAALTEVLRQARAPTAKAVIAATSNELLNLEIALLVRELTPKQRIVVRLTDPDLATTLRQAANVRFALSIPELAALAFVASLYDKQLQGLFQVEGRLLAVYALVIADPLSPLIGRPVRTLTTQDGFLPVQHVDAAGAARPAGTDTIISLGDRLTGIIPLDYLQKLFRREAGEQGPMPDGTQS